MLEDLVNTLQRLAEVLQTERSLGVALASIAEAATTSVPGCDAATIAISINGRPATAAMTGIVALELDLVQYDNDDGPCLTTFRSASALRLDLQERGEAFPHIARAAARVGVRGVLSVPSVWGGETVATLNLYSRGGSFDESAETVAMVLATQVAIAVSRSPEFAAARAVVEEAQRETDDQSQIAVATGMLINSQDCTREQAEGLLRQAADEDAQTILQIAQRIIEQHHNTR
ncbi:MAG TPA: GAF domain-containing protein [Ilumatobacteraceae bacterium]|nr:GAF domain-containing protein [Ilumatobacteraceae bacterium]